MEEKHGFVIVFIGANNLVNFHNAQYYLESRSGIDSTRTTWIERVDTQEEFVKGTLGGIISDCSDTDVFFIHDNERAVKTVKVAGIIPIAPGHVDYDVLGKLRKYINDKLQGDAGKVEHRTISHPNSPYPIKDIIHHLGNKNVCEYAIGIDLSMLELKNEYDGTLEDETLIEYLTPFITFLKKWNLKNN